MDPAFAITSPFRNEAKAVDGALDRAITDVTSSAMPTSWAPASTTNGAVVSSPSTASTSGQTPCMLCGSRSTPALVPADGIYVCTDCAVPHANTSTQRSFPTGTFTCCPSSTEEGDGGVLRCASCRGWYHCRCVGLQSGALKDYATLSTTLWYCPREACCDQALQSHLKRKR